jgi:hypothetical protein
LRTAHAAELELASREATSELAAVRDRCVSELGVMRLELESTLVAREAAESAEHTALLSETAQVAVVCKTCSGTSTSLDNAQVQLCCISCDNVWPL